MTFHPSSREYVKSFMRMMVYHGHSHGDNGEFTIAMPDHRGRIAFDGKKISIDGNSTDVCLVGEIPNKGRINIKQTDTIEINEKDLNKSELWLLTKENEILDFRSIIEGQYSYSGINDEHEKSEQILALIERGECHEIEFKPYIDLTNNKNSKANEIEKTVCALSNAKGGYLLAGVEDDGCIEGIDKKLLDHYKMAIDGAIEAYIKDIGKRLREKLRYNQCFDISLVKIGEKHVIVVSVERSEKPNYFVNSDVAYIRKGATSAKMKSSDERENDNQSLFPLH